MYKISILIIIYLATNSCSYIIPILSKEYTYCYTEDSTSINSLINIDGIYFPEDVINGLDTISYGNAGYFSPKYVFYNNSMTTKNIPRNWYVPDKNNEDNLNNGGTWGMYFVSGDTIMAKYISCCSGQTSHIHDVWFKVIDKNTIKQICCFKNIDGTISTEVFKFIPQTFLPDSEESWLIKRKRFWCNKSEWKAFRQNLKKSK